MSDLCVSKNIKLQWKDVGIQKSGCTSQSPPSVSVPLLFLSEASLAFFSLPAGVWPPQPLWSM